MKQIKSFLLIIGLSSLFLSCQENEDKTFVLAALDNLIQVNTEQPDKTVLIVSSNDCGKCFSTELKQLLQTDQLDAALVVSFDKPGKLDKETSTLLSNQAVPVFEEHSPELLIALGKYSGNPKSPYIATYSEKSLKIEALVEH